MSQLKLRRPVLGHSSEKWYDKHITSAQVLALNATAIEITPTPVTGWHLVPTGFALYKPAGTAYDGIGAGEELAIKYTDKNGLQVASIASAGFFDQVTAQIRHAYPYCAASGAGAGSSLAATTAKPLTICLLVGEIATGDAPLKIRTFYYELPDAIAPV